MLEYIDKLSVVNRLIDLENEFQQYKPFHGFEHAMYRKLCEAEIAIGKEQSADVAQVRHGQWIFDDYTKRLRCSECEAYKPYEMIGDIVDYWDCDYCPNCGAKMDGGADNG